jgi:hypothetical protein
MSDAKTVTLQEARRKTSNPLAALQAAQGEANPRRRQRAAKKVWAAGSHKQSTKMQKLREPRKVKKARRKASRVRT